MDPFSVAVAIATVVQGLGTIAAVVISIVALRVSRQAQRASEQANEPNIRFHLVCHRFSSKASKAAFSSKASETHLELITSNLSGKGNALVKTRLALMDGPPALMAVRSEDGGETFAKAGVEFPPEMPFEVRPVDPDRPIRSIGARLVRSQFEPPLEILASSSRGSRLVFGASRRATGACL